jgi:uncharacterized protein YecE (DUF72 family)
VTAPRIRIGTAGWSVPRAVADRFAGRGTHLQRYASVLKGVEINSSFHRPHRVGTYAQWATATPPDFRFAIKLPKAITHDARLRRARMPLEQFLAESAGLGEKRGPILVQLPPSLEFEAGVAARFFDLLRARHEGGVVCEPRHPTWFSARAETLLCRQRIARVAADPAPAPGAEVPGGWSGLVYYRLHGSPRMYWSRYETQQLAALADAVRRVPQATEVWCVFDNTASGAALDNAWGLNTLLTAGIGTASG